MEKKRNRKRKYEHQEAMFYVYTHYPLTSLSPHRKIYVEVSGIHADMKISANVCCLIRKSLLSHTCTHQSQIQRSQNVSIFIVASFLLCCNQSNTMYKYVEYYIRTLTCVIVHIWIKYNKCVYIVFIRIKMF